MSFLDNFIDWGSESLFHSDEATSYFIGRGVSELQMRKHRLGFVGGDFIVDSKEDSEHNSECGSNDKRSLWCDSCRFVRWSTKTEEDENGSKSYFPGRRISNCAILPITSYSGFVIGFQVRSISEKSYDTFLLKRRPESYFFGTASAMSSIWSRKEVFLVEGAYDHLILERLVAPNVLALTTNAVNESQRRFLLRFVNCINFCLDMDLAGRQGLKSFLDHADSSNFRIRDIKYPKIKPNDKDLGDFWKSVGDDSFKEFFSKKIAEMF